MNEVKTQLFKNVDLSAPASHPQLIAHWSRPGELADGAQVPVAIYVPVIKDGMRDTEWVMDYLDMRTSSFLSEEQDLDLPWPWAQGFVPNARDWDAIGIPALS